MRISSEGTDIEAEFYVMNGDRKCEEFILLGRPTSNNDETPLKECYIAVTENSHISIHGLINGTMHQARIDLIVDGSWVGDRAVEPPRIGVVKVHNRRKIEFKTVNSIIEAPQTENEQDSPTMIDGELIATPLPLDVDPLVLVGDGETFGVGSIVVIISIEQDTSPGYLANPCEYPDYTVGAWKSRAHEIRNAGILPTHSLAMQNVSESAIKQKANKMYRRFQEPKLGYKPFAKLIFNYRSQSALTAAGVIPAPNRVYPVEREKVELAPINSPPMPAREPQAGGLFVSPSSPDAACSVRLVNHSSFIPSWGELTLVHEQERFQRCAMLQQQWTEQMGQQANTPMGGVQIKQEPDEEGIFVQVAGLDHELPSIKAICDTIPKNGLSINKVLRHFLPDVAKHDRSEAAKLFLHYMHDFAALRYDQRGTQLVIKRCHLEELKRQSMLLNTAIAQKRTFEESQLGPEGLTNEHSKRSRIEARDLGQQTEEVIVKVEAGL